MARGPPIGSRKRGSGSRSLDKELSGEERSAGLENKGKSYDKRKENDLGPVINAN